MDQLRQHDLVLLELILIGPPGRQAALELAARQHLRCQSRLQLGELGLDGAAEAVGLPKRFRRAINGSAQRGAGRLIRVDGVGLRTVQEIQRGLFAQCLLRICRPEDEHGRVRLADIASDEDPLDLCVRDLELVGRRREIGFTGDELRLRI
ncbi:unannotated protein [freshwater metagenome]|uniref:Unannotated protein n=1 Tax=freshwater metagenome TaxID=449393 RepID=A0A6J7IIJ4_9ZZZZ